MNELVKVKKLAAENAKLKEDVQKVMKHAMGYAEMAQAAIQALRYIATDGKCVELKEDAARILDAMGMPYTRRDVAPAKTVANECLSVMEGIRQSIGQQEVEKEAEKIEVVQLAEEGVIPLSTKFDVFFHQCCRCGLVHEVQIDWPEPVMVIAEASALPVVVNTTWRQMAGVPTAGDIEAGGGKVVKLHKGGTE